MKNSKILYLIFFITLIVFLVCSCSDQIDITNHSDYESNSNIPDTGQTSNTGTKENQDTSYSSTDAYLTENIKESTDSETLNEYVTISLNGIVYALFPFKDGDLSGQYDPNESSAHLYPTREFDSKLDRLIAEYLLSGEEYKELVDMIYYQYVCDSTLLHSSYSKLERYHNDGETTDFPEYMLRKVKEDGRLGNEYYVARYGNITAFDEYEDYLNRRFDPEIISEIFNENSPCVINVNGYIFARDCGIGYSGQERDPKYSILVDEGIIVLCEQRTIYDQDSGTEEYTMIPTDESIINYNILKKVKYGSEFVWKWIEINHSYPVQDEYEFYSVSK